MKLIVIKVFKYIEPMWLGNDGKLSIRKFLSLLFALDLVKNFHHIIIDWETGKSYADAALLLGIEAGLIAALLSLTTYSSVVNKQSNIIDE